MAMLLRRRHQHLRPSLSGKPWGGSACGCSCYLDADVVGALFLGHAVSAARALDAWPDRRRASSPPLRRRATSRRRPRRRRCCAAASSDARARRCFPRRAGAPVRHARAPRRRLRQRPGGFDFFCRHRLAWVATWSPPRSRSTRPRSPAAALFWQFVDAAWPGPLHGVLSAAVRARLVRRRARRRRGRRLRRDLFFAMTCAAKSARESLFVLPLALPIPVHRRARRRRARPGRASVIRPNCATVGGAVGCGGWWRRSSPRRWRSAPSTSPPSCGGALIEAAHRAPLAGTQGMRTMLTGVFRDPEGRLARLSRSPPSSRGSAASGCSCPAPMAGAAENAGGRGSARRGCARRRGARAGLASPTLGAPCRARGFTPSSRHGCGVGFGPLLGGGWAAALSARCSSHMRARYVDPWAKGARSRSSSSCRAARDVRELMEESGADVVEGYRPVRDKQQPVSIPRRTRARKAMPHKRILGERAFHGGMPAPLMPAATMRKRSTSSLPEQIERNGSQRIGRQPAVDSAQSSGVCGAEAGVGRSELRDPAAAGARDHRSRRLCDRLLLVRGTKTDR